MTQQSPPQITLVQFPGLSHNGSLSPPCAKVHMALRFKGLSYQVKNVGTPREAKRHNPRGRVPALLLDGETIVDSTDILTALEARFPEPPLEPSTPGERAQAKILEDWADEVLYFYGVWVRFGDEGNFQRLRRLFFAKLPPPLRWIAPGFIRSVARRRCLAQGVALKDEATLRRELGECLDAIVELLAAGPFLVGARLSRADLAVAAVLDQLGIERLVPATAAELASRPALVAWRERVHALAPTAAG